jgi:L-amino acid N-acyltransferase YncA
MRIRKATVSDFDAIWRIFRAVVELGDTYAFTPDTGRDDAFTYWCGPRMTTYVAEDAGRIVGMYRLVPNHPGLGSHVANASFMVDPALHGKGLGEQLTWHCLEEARKLGYLAMQFNLVVSTNEAALALWKKLGFSIVGTLPKAFKHTRFGYVDAYVMYRLLD